MTPIDPDPRHSGPDRGSALVLSTDVVAAALLGALLETLDLDPLFAAPDESPRDAVRRLRPRTVLVDCEHGDACSDAFFGPARMLGATIVLFGGARSADKVRDLAARHGVPVMVLPAPVAEMARVIRG